MLSAPPVAGSSRPRWSCRRSRPRRPRASVVPAQASPRRRPSTSTTDHRRSCRRRAATRPRTTAAAAQGRRRRRPPPSEGAPPAAAPRREDPQHGRAVAAQASSAPLRRRPLRPQRVRLLGPRALRRQAARPDARCRTTPRRSSTSPSASPRSNLRPGDLVFFFRRGAHHVGVYIGRGRMVSATNPRAGVKVDRVFTRLVRLALQRRRSPRLTDALPLHRCPAPSRGAGPAASGPVPCRACARTWENATPATRRVRRAQGRVARAQSAHPRHTPGARRSRATRRHPWPRLRGDKDVDPGAPAQGRGPGARHRAHGRRGHVLHRRPDPGVGSDPRAGERRAAAARRPPRPLRPRRRRRAAAPRPTRSSPRPPPPSPGSSAPDPCPATRPTDPPPHRGERT